MTARTETQNLEELLGICKFMLARLDLQAREEGEDAIFPLAGIRSMLRESIRRADNGAS